MLKSYLFGEYAPDLNPIAITSFPNPNAPKHLAGLKNAFPVENGYAPVPSFGAITPALAAAFKGGGAFIGSDGTSSLLAGTATNLYKYTGSAWSSVLGSLTAGRWYFAQFGNNIMCAGAGQLISYNALAGTAAAIGAAPTATDVATVRDFVVVLEPGGDQLSVQWSAFNDSTAWTPGLNQSGNQPLLSGGKGMKIVGGEYGLVLQRGAIKRMTYVGVPLVFQFDQISGEVGCMARGSVANAGKFVFFLSELGFMVCDGETVTPIGFEKIDRTFFSTYSREDIQNITAAIDPRRPFVMWAMPGTPGTIWCYNWQLQKWSTIQLDVASVFTGFTSNISLDALDGTYGNLDAIPYSLDDPRFAGGNPLLLLANNSNVLGTLSGPNLPASFTLPNVEPNPGQRTRVRSVRPISDATDVVATIDARGRPGDAANVATASAMRSNGEMPIRANGRYLGTTVGMNPGAAWSFCQGAELFCEPAGLR